MLGDIFHERAGQDLEIVWDGEADRAEVCFSLLGPEKRESALAPLVRMERRYHPYSVHRSDPRLIILKAERAAHCPNGLKRL